MAKIQLYTLSGKVLPYLDIREDLRPLTWEEEYAPGTYITYTLKRKEESDLDMFLIENFNVRLGEQILVYFNF